MELASAFELAVKFVDADAAAFLGVDLLAQLLATRERRAEWRGIKRGRDEGYKAGQRDARSENLMRATIGLAESLWRHARAALGIAK